MTSDQGVRILNESEFRAANTLFRETIHYGPVPNEQWERVNNSYTVGLVLGSYDGDSLIGTAMSYPSRLAVPGAATVPTATVSRIGVRADRTRRGVLTSLMRTQLNAVAAEGDLAATLHASEALIYGRFGYGVASRARTLRVTAERAALRPSVPLSGSVRLLDRAELVDVIPPLYERIGLHQPGMISRPEQWWEFMLRRPLDAGELIRAAAHVGDTVTTDSCSTGRGARSTSTIP